VCVCVCVRGEGVCERVRGECVCVCVCVRGEGVCVCVTLCARVC
jgi:hypothetical protein